MKKIHCFILLCLHLGVFAQTQDCDTLLDNDEQAICSALQQKATRFCDAISTQDKRLLCMAKVQPNSYTCENIKAAGIRSECLLHVKKVQSAAIYNYPSSKKP
ncbi:MAG: hypothetical protein EBQ82_05750 [Betaproteobacteria bacterium]|nr:hypothetical protein [Betaproteobacteria bacterium]NBY04889.1 hypothetical protein [Betaproteobacteria bacterium]